jgi:hypothetical protein
MNAPRNRHFFLIDLLLLPAVAVPAFVLLWQWWARRCGALGACSVPPFAGGAE